MSRLISIAGLLLLVFGVNSCCPTCEKPYLGVFPINVSTGDWVGFSNRIDLFEKTVGQSVQTTTLTYSDLFINVGQFAVDCDEISDRCGVCCSELDAENFTIQAFTANNEFVFDIAVQKDFESTPFDLGADNVEDYLTIAVNNDPELFCRLNNLGSATLTDVVTLNGITFSNVYACEKENVNDIKDAGKPTGVYFSQTDGIVGWRVGESEYWVLRK